MTCAVKRTVQQFLAMESIREYLEFLYRDRISLRTVDWPPDAFASAASLLERSGGYLAVGGQWPPQDPEYPEFQSWAESVCETGRKWRQAAVAGSASPKLVRSHWNVVIRSNLQVQQIGQPGAESAAVRNSLLWILAAADEACEGVGIPGGEMTEFQNLNLNLLLDQQASGSPSTLCKRISTSKLSVLPKLHTPQAGITIRSLSHHVALCPVTEIKPRWTWVSHPELHERRHGMNLLVVPWPLELEPTAFSRGGGTLSNLPSQFGFFEFRVRGGAPLNIELLRSLIQRASATVGPVDMIVFPELALVPDDMALLAQLIESLDPQPIIIGGMCIPGSDGMCRNTSVTIVPMGKNRAFALSQDKHHRWLLDGNQVKQYGLGGVLDPTVDWWENAVMARRELGFLSILPWLTLCTLICEDLARPDPIANLVRAVGPNLIIALLMDGPQLSNRWPARYGTVLADDPGSSVLTVSPLGMVRLSRPRGTAPSNVVALWKDTHCGAPIEISLQTGDHGVLLSLTRAWRKEYSADGRHDSGTTAYLTLSGIHSIRASTTEK